MKQILIFCIAPLLLFSCGSSKSTVNNSPVTESRKDIVLEPLPELPNSSIQIPVKINVRKALNSLDGSTPLEFTSDNWPAYFQADCDFRYMYRFVRSPFQFSLRNNEVNISFRGNYQIAGSKTICAFGRPVMPWVSGSCGFDGQSLRRVDLNINSKLAITPDLNISTTTVLNKVTPLDKCEVSLLQTDITKDIMDSIKSSIESYCQSFDEFVQNINNHELLSREKNSGSKVMPISNYGFLNLNPNLLRISPLSLQGDSLSFSLGFWGSPGFSSDSLSLVTDKPLPPLLTTDSEPGITTYLNAVYEYDFFNKMLNDSLYDKPFEIEGRTFVIKNIHVSGNNNGKIQIALQFTGNRSGVLRLSGTPVLDRETQTLTMPDISFGFDTRDLMIKIAENFFRKKIMRQLQDKSVFDIAALINENKALINERLNQPLNEYLSTRGALSEIAVIGIRPGEKSIQLQLFIKGNISIAGEIPEEMLSE